MTYLISFKVFHRLSKIFWIALALCMMVISSSNESESRRLIVTTDSALSVVSGTGISNFEAFESVTVTVQAKYSDGSDKVTGGDQFVLAVTNQCEISDKFSCEAVVGQEQVLAENIYELMTDNGDGTYTYTFTVKLNGVITVAAYLVSGGVYAEYFDNFSWAYPYAHTDIEPGINHNWGGSSFLPGHNVDSFTSRYYFFMVGPINGPVLLRCQSDNIGKLYLNGALFIDCTNWNVAASITTELNKLYEMRLDYGESWGMASILFSWSYTGQATIAVPPSHLLAPSYVGLSPIDVTVTCPTGFYGLPTYTDECKTVCGDNIAAGTEVCDNVGSSGCSLTCDAITTGWVCHGSSPNTCEECSGGFYPNSISNPTKCVTQCGDGLTVGAEECDDLNVNSGDGCDNDCKIEDGWVCDQDSPSSCTQCTSGFVPNDSKDECVLYCGDAFVTDSEECDDGNTQSGDGCDNDCIIEEGWICTGETNSACDECKLGYEPNSTKDECSVKPKSTESTAASGTVLGVAGVGMIASGITSLLTKSSPQSAFSMMNFIQILLILPLIGAFIPEKVVQFLIGLLITLFNLDFIPFIEIPYISDFADEISFKQSNSYMYLIGLEDGSALINVFNLIGLLLALPLLHILLLLISYCIKPKGKDSWVCKLFCKLLDWLTFGAYIRVIQETYLLGCLTIVSEIVQTDLSKRGQIISFTFACVLSVLLTFIIYAFFAQWVKSRKPDQFAKQKYFREMFAGIRSSFIARVFNCQFLVRRSLFIIIVMICAPLPMKAKVSTYLTVQIIHYILIVGIRPFEKAQDNITEILFETTHSLLLCLLCYYNQEDRWSNAISSLFIYSIMATTTIATCISILVLVIEIRKWRNRKSTSKVEAFKAEPKQEEVAPDESAIDQPTPSRQEVFESSHNTSQHKFNAPNRLRNFLRSDDSDVAMQKSRRYERHLSDES